MTKTWRFPTKVLKYNMFLSKAAHSVVRRGKAQFYKSIPNFLDQ
jgi:hypothetical protein